MPRQLEKGILTEGAAVTVSDIAAWTSIGTFSFAVLGVIALYFGRRKRVGYLSTKIPLEVASFRINLRIHYNKALRGFGDGEIPTDDAPVSLAEILGTRKDHQLMEQLLPNNSGVYSGIHSIGRLYDEYQLWGRIVRFGRRPKTLEGTD